MAHTRAVARWIMQHWADNPPVAVVAELLTPREQAVAGLVADGLEMKEIARELGVGYHTVKMHLYNAKSKLGARNQIELALLMHGHTPRAMRQE